MKSALMALGLCGIAAIAAAASDESAGPASIAPTVPIPAPRDRPYAGLLTLAVDATDITHRVITVHETLTGFDTDAVLLYPQWLPGAHAPEGPIERLGNLRISAQGTAVRWTRDRVNVYALRIYPARGTRALTIDFQYLSPTSAATGGQEMSAKLLIINWNTLLLYPAGYFARRIPVEASLRLPAGWHFATALESDAPDTVPVNFTAVNLATFVDSPVYAGTYTSRLDLDPGGAVPTHLDLFADRPQALVLMPAQLQAYRALVQQAYKLFGSHHYGHYDFLYSLSDQIVDMGLEHHQSSEDGGPADAFTDWDREAFERDLLPHEFTHSWNGKFRRPADLWTPNFNVPMQDSLLWIYEGLTQYWGKVLAARSGLRTRDQALEQFALDAAYDQNAPGRQWRSLQDTTNDEIINPRRPLSWRDWQRFEDYYNEGSLIWLEADTLIRERSQGARSLDDFARRFFGINNGSFVTVTYTFEDVVTALNAVQPYDWASFLRERLDSIGRPAPLEGLRRGGYQLVYTDTPSPYQKNLDDKLHRQTLLYSIGVTIDDSDKPGSLSEVLWDGPAFRAGLTTGAQILAVNGVAYSAEVLRDAIRGAQGTSGPIELIVKTGEAFGVTELDYHDGLRYPHLQRDSTAPARLDAILAPLP